MGHNPTLHLQMQNSAACILSPLNLLAKRHFADSILLIEFSAKMCHNRPLILLYILLHIVPLHPQTECTFKGENQCKRAVAVKWMRISSFKCGTILH
jgi:hypothetical protein